MNRKAESGWMEKKWHILTLCSFWTKWIISEFFWKYSFSKQELLGTYLCSCRYHTPLMKLKSLLFAWIWTTTQQKQHQNGLLWPKMALHDPKWPCNDEPSWPKISLHDPKCPCMTQNGPKILLMGILDDIMTYWTTLGPFQRPTWPQWASEKAPRWSSMTQYHIIL